jgi:hypothetical protein
MARCVAVRAITVAASVAAGACARSKSIDARRSRCCCCCMRRSPLLVEGWYGEHQSSQVDDRYMTFANIPLKDCSPRGSVDACPHRSRTSQQHSAADKATSGSAHVCTPITLLLTMFYRPKCFALLLCQTPTANAADFRAAPLGRALPHSTPLLLLRQSSATLLTAAGLLASTATCCKACHLRLRRVQGGFPRILALTPPSMTASLSYCAGSASASRACVYVPQ